MLALGDRRLDRALVSDLELRLAAPQPSRHGHLDVGSRIGAAELTTAELAARVVKAIDTPSHRTGQLTALSQAMHVDRWHLLRGGDTEELGKGACPGGRGWVRTNDFNRVKGHERPVRADPYGSSRPTLRCRG